MIWNNGSFILNKSSRNAIKTLELRLEEVEERVETLEKSLDEVKARLIQKPNIDTDKSLKEAILKKPIEPKEAANREQANKPTGAHWEKQNQYINKAFKETTWTDTARKKKPFIRGTSTGNSVESGAPLTALFEKLKGKHKPHFDLTVRVNPRLEDTEILSKLTMRIKKIMKAGGKKIRFVSVCVPAKEEPPSRVGTYMFFNPMRGQKT